MAHSNELNVMKQIAHLRNYSPDKKVSSFPLITYCTPHVTENDDEVLDVMATSVDRNQHIKATAIAMRCNIPVNLFGTYLLNLCQTDEDGDLQNLRSDNGEWLKNWNGIWILQCHGAITTVTVDDSIDGEKFYKLYGEYIIEQKGFRAGILKSCHSTQQYNTDFFSRLSFAESLRSCSKKEEVILIGSSVATSIVDFTSDKYWGLPTIYPDAFFKCTFKQPDDFAQYFNQDVKTIEKYINTDQFTLSYANEHKDMSLFLKDDFSIYKFVTEKFFNMATLDPNNLFVTKEVLTLINDEEDNDQNEEKKNEDTVSDLGKILDPKIRDIDDPAKLFPDFYWYKTGKLLNSDTEKLKDMKVFQQHLTQQIQNRQNIPSTGTANPNDDPK
ncbi:hypothetical protein [uncultured Sneathiella sp.]|uniref:hypothetical protein n=1 Tax=uncultured Sneathiella sp. TaxID=879315 RepID=UPI0030EDBC6C|tara:strand:+ start:13843 stop:14997 length:1155 start_codon:yes stop_codon:yes gene_type:complete